MKKTGVIILLLISFISKAQTSVSGGIFSNQQWTMLGSPYIVTGDVAVFPGNTLTIDPGVEIKVDGYYSIFIRGEIILNGTTSNPITFSANSTTTINNAWTGLVFENLSGSNINLNNVTIKNAYEAIDISQGIGSISINNCFFENNQYGVDFYNSFGSFSATIDNSNFQNVSYGVWFAEILTMEYCQFSNGIKAVYGGLSGSGITINHCSFDNFTGEYSLNMGGTLFNSTISNCHRGVRLRPTLTVTSCNFTDNNIATENSHPFNYTNTMTLTSFCNNATDIKHFNSYNIDMSNNCWCSSDNNPDDGIIDAYDDVSLGIISYLPFATSNCGSTVTGGINSINFQNNNVKIYPNPTSSSINIDLEETKSNVNLLLTNAIGQVVFTKNYKSTNHINFDLDAPKGLYFLQIETADGETETRKIIKK